ncbi:unknown protein [Desulfotalea psychrophila LSv54]|uniref:Uncharacterized protein n=2 Tax=Desulfotalea psychrophila TaxID=84980 RepID=Q6AMS0_DESPS|nr:unknown protein [Desulfotalea psychrophila LSv54]
MLRTAKKWPCMHFFYEKITYIFDPLYHLWEHEKIHRKIAATLMLFFIASIIAIECNRQGWLPEGIATILPLNHFYAVQAAFTVVLILEVISLIFSIPRSFSRSVGTQFEIFSLILMRNAFKELSYFPEPISYAGNEEAILRILSNGFGALLIFSLLGLYYIIQKRSCAEQITSTDLYAFVAIKKGVALLLLTFFIIMGLRSMLNTLMGISHGDFFHDFYTLLILADILLVLSSQCFQPSFYAIFRNSGYALATLIIRIALAAPPFYNVLLGLAAASFAILLTLASNNLFHKQAMKHTPPIHSSA